MFPWSKYILEHLSQLSWIVWEGKSPELLEKPGFPPGTPTYFPLPIHVLSFHWPNLLISVRPANHLMCMGMSQLSCNDMFCNSFVPSPYWEYKHIRQSQASKYLGRVGGTGGIAVNQMSVQLAAILDVWLSLDHYETFNRTNQRMQLPTFCIVSFKIQWISLLHYS